MSQFHTQSPLHQRYHKYLSTPHPRLKMHWWQLGMIYPPQSTGPCPEYKIVHFQLNLSIIIIFSWIPSYRFTYVGYVLPLEAQVTFLWLHSPSCLLQLIVSPLGHASDAQSSWLSPTAYVSPSGHRQVPPIDPTPGTFSSTMFSDAIKLVGYSYIILCWP